MDLAWFQYALPAHQVAQTPLADRSAARLVRLDRKTGAVEHQQFTDIPSQLRSGDLLICNDSRVLPARLFARKQQGGRLEILLLQARADDVGVWEALLRPARRVHAGMKFHVTAALWGQVIERLAEPAGGFLIRLYQDESHRPLPMEAVHSLLTKVGQVPLPPYIRNQQIAPDRYQTVFAQHSGSIAAPTAGLHVSKGWLAALRDRGVEQAFVTLHVGLGTFLPVKTPSITDHVMHSERFVLPATTVAAIARARQQGGRVIALGTTVVRVLETAARQLPLQAQQGTTSLFIVPGFSFRVVDGLITNFHWPGSTLLMLVAAFAGREQVLAAYRAALLADYRFGSFGDAMAIW